MTHSIAGAAAHGAIAGVIGASSMTVLRMFAHRAGWVQQMVPQAVEAWASRAAVRHGAPAPRGLATRHVADQLLHFGYGATWGALFGVLHARAAANGPGSAVGFGLIQWAFGSMLLFPALNIGKPPWRSGSRENFVNVTAHLAYAALTSFLVEELRRQETDQPRTYEGSRHARLG